MNDPESFHTSAPTPQECLSVFRKAAARAPAILCVTVSKKLSRVYDSAVAATELIKDESPGTKIEVVDSRQATSSEGMVALAAARAAEEGKELAEVVQAAQDIVDKVHTIFFLDTLQHVYRSGRIPKVASQLGSMLSIKPILTVSETVKFAGMARSHKKGIEKILEMMRERVNGRPVHAAVTHAYVPEDAIILKERLAREFNCVELWMSEFSPVMGYATGTGTLGISFYTDD